MAPCMHKLSQVQGARQEIYGTAQKVTVQMGSYFRMINKEGFVIEGN